MTLLGHSVADQSGMLLSMDEAVADFLGRSKAELRGLSYTDITHPDDRRMNVSRISQLCAAATPLSLRKRYLRPSGEIAWATVQVSKLETGSDAGRLIGTIFDLDFTAAQPSPVALWQAAQSQMLLIVQSHAVLGGEFFSNHGWVVLIMLYLAEAEGRGIDQEVWPEAMGIRPASIDRWLRALRDRGLVEFGRIPDSQPQLTQRGIDRIEKLLSPIADALTAPQR